MSIEPRCPKWSALLPIALVGLVALAIAASPAAAQTSNTPPAFATGSVTSLHGTSVQVTNPTQNSESTVVLSPSTQVTKRETAAVSAITVGTCVRVTGTGSAAKGITAQSVALSAASASGCTGAGPGGAGGPGGAAGSGGFRFGNGQRPPNAGNRAGGGFGNRAGGRPTNFALASGPVLSVSGDSMVVKSTTFQRPSTSSTKKSSSSKKGAKSTAKPKVTTSKVTVKFASSTSVTQTVAGATSDVAVGACVTATGTTDGGNVDAARVVVSQPVNGSCSAGFGGFGRRGGGATGGTGGQV